MKYIQIISLSALLLFTACQDKGYGTQEISKIPILTAIEKLTIVQRTPVETIAKRSYINLEFSAYINPLTISSSTVSMSDTNGSIIPIELELDNANLHILPAVSLQPTHIYTLSLSSAIADTVGNASAQNYNFTYLCKEDFWLSVVSGYTHSMAQSKDGEIYFWGTTSATDIDKELSVRSYTAPLGITRIKKPHAVSSGNNSAAVITSSKSLISFEGNDFNKLSLGNNHATTIKDNGTLWSWGENDKGQLGNAGFLKKSILVQEFTKSTLWKEVSAGENYTVALKSDGTMWGWGSNTYGQIGNSILNERRIPQQEDTNTSDWKNISAGANHTSAIKQNGSLWSWGLNSSGELGTGNNNSSRTAVRENTNNTDWESVSNGYNHTLALDKNGTLWSWGSNYYGQLGLGTNTNKNTPTRVTSLSNVVSISAGKYFSLAVDENGILWSWGRNSHKQLGLSVQEDQLRPQKVQ